MPNSNLTTTSSNNTIAVRLQDKWWLAATCINAVSYFFLTWIFTGLVVFATRTGKLKDLKNPNQMKRNSGIVFLFAIVAVGSCYPVLIADTVLYNLGYSPTNQPCQIAVDISSTFAFLTMTLVLLFFWVRQKVLYQLAVMSDLANLIWVRILCWTSLILLVGCVGNIPFVVTVWFRSYSTLGSGCWFSSLIPFTAAYLFTAVYTVTQVTLLILFVYPLRKMTQERNKLRARSMYVRTAALVLTAVVSVNLMPLFQLLTVKTKGVHGIKALIEVNVMLMSFCVVLSFKAVWKKILFPCISKDDEQEPDTVETAA